MVSVWPARARASLQLSVSNLMLIEMTFLLKNQQELVSGLILYSHWYLECRSGVFTVA